MDSDATFAPKLQTKLSRNFQTRSFSLQKIDSGRGDYCVPVLIDYSDVCSEFVGFECELLSIVLSWLCNRSWYALELMRCTANLPTIVDKIWDHSSAFYIRFVTRYYTVGGRSVCYFPFHNAISSWLVNVGERFQRLVILDSSQTRRLVLNMYWWPHLDCNAGCSLSYSLSLSLCDSYPRIHGPAVHFLCYRFLWVCSNDRSMMLEAIFILYISTF